MKKIPVILFLMLVSVASLFSQYRLNSHQVLKKVLQNVKSYKTIEIDFMVNMEDAIDNRDTTVFVNLKLKGDKFLLKADKESMLCDGVNFYDMDTVSKTYHSSKMPDSNDGEVWPHTLLNFYESGFKSQAIGTKTDDKNRNIMHIELIPEKNKKFKYRSASLDVDLDKFEITKIMLRDDSSNHEVVSFEIQSMKVNHEMDDSVFTIDKTKYQERK